MWSNVAYFSMWRPHGNRVSKTRFITLINIEKNPEEEEEEKRNLGRVRLGNAPPRSRAAQVARRLGNAPPRSRTAQVARRLGNAPPRSHATQATRCLGFFQPGRLIIIQWLTHIEFISDWWSGIRSVQHGSESLDSFSLWSDCCVSGFLKFFLCISACTRETWDFKFF